MVMWLRSRCTMSIPLLVAISAMIMMVQFPLAAAQVFDILIGFHRCINHAVRAHDVRFTIPRDKLHCSLCSDVHRCS